MTVFGSFFPFSSELDRLPVESNGRWEVGGYNGKSNLHQVKKN